MKNLAWSLLVVSALSCTSKEAAPAKSPVAAPSTVPAPPFPAVSKWALDPENSSVTFSCKHVFTNVRGLFQRPTGTLTLDQATPGNSKLEASLDVGTITTGVEERDTHLKSADFFDAAKFPTATFTSTSVSGAAPNFTVVGDLTMHGVTKPVTLAVTTSQTFNHGGGVRRAIEATTSVNRRDFGLRWDYPGEGPGAVVGDVITLGIDAELVLQP